MPPLSEAALVVTGLAIVSAGCTDPAGPGDSGCGIATQTAAWTVGYTAVPSPLLESRARDVANGFVVGQGRFPDGTLTGFLLNPSREVTRLQPGSGDDLTEAVRVIVPVFPWTAPC